MLGPWGACCVTYGVSVDEAKVWILSNTHVKYLACIPWARALVARSKFLSSRADYNVRRSMYLLWPANVFYFIGGAPDRVSVSNVYFHGIATAVQFVLAGAREYGEQVLR